MSDGSGSFRSSKLPYTNSEGAAPYSRLQYELRMSLVYRKYGRAEFEGISSDVADAFVLSALKKLCVQRGLKWQDVICWALEVRVWLRADDLVEFVIGAPPRLGRINGLRSWSIGNG